MATFSTENDNKLKEIDSFLANNQFLSGSVKPNCQDSKIFFEIQNKKWYPEQEKYPNIFTWYGWLNMFSSAIIKKWGEQVQVEQAKPETKKAETAAAPAEDDDLFGDDNEDEEAKKKKEEEAKQKAEEKKKQLQEGKAKKVVIAKTIFFFEVKVYEMEQDLKALAQKIFTEVQMDGLVWVKDYKILPVAYGMNKLSINCVVEDDKVCSDDIVDKISSWEDEVQSVDTVGMQKV